MRPRRPLKNIETIKNLGIFCWSIIGLLIIIALFFYIVYLIKIAVIPLLIAFGIAYFLTPLVLLLERKMKRIFAVVITYVVFTSLIFVVFFFMVPVITEQFKVFASKFPFYLNNLVSLITVNLRNSSIIHTLENLIGKEIIPADPNVVTQYIINSFNMKDINFLQSITSFTRSLVNIVITFIIGPILGIYVLKDSGRLKNLFIKVLPQRFKSQASIIIDKISRVSGRYIRGQILISIIVGILCTIILLVLGIDFPILLGFIAGIFNLVPFLGPIIGGVPAALAALFISPIKALLVVILFIGVHQVDSYIISPNIMKFQVGVHPAIVIFSLIASGAIFGPIGLLLAVPTVAVFQEILKYYLIERKNTVSL